MNLNDFRVFGLATLHHGIQYLIDDIVNLMMMVLRLLFLLQMIGRYGRRVPQLDNGLLGSLHKQRMTVSGGVAQKFKPPPLATTNGGRAYFFDLRIFLLRLHGQTLEVVLQRLQQSDGVLVVGDGRRAAGRSTVGHGCRWRRRRRRDTYA